MLLKIFALLDLITALSIILVKFNIHFALFWVLPIYLILKGVIFLPDISSIIDIITGIVFIFALLGMFSIFTWIMVLWLMQKFFFSL